jgi:hypothetical protein
MSVRISYKKTWTISQERRKLTSCRLRADLTMSCMGPLALASFSLPSTHWGATLHTSTTAHISNGGQGPHISSVNRKSRKYADKI